MLSNWYDFYLPGEVKLSLKLLASRSSSGDATSGDTAESFRAGFLLSEWREAYLAILEWIVVWM